MYTLEQFRWWTKSKNVLAQDVFSYVKAMDQNQKYKQSQNIQNMRLYGDDQLFNLKNFAAYRAEASSAVQNRVTLNVIRSMIDTVVSKITKNKPKPTFLTEGGDFSLQRRAQKLTQFVQGQFQACQFYAKAAIAFLDSCIFGTGVLKIFRDGNDIKVERVFPDEIKVDDSESIYGEPRQMHQVKYVQKDVLKGMFPKKASEIDSVNKNPSEDSSSTNAVDSDMIQVIESWHLKSSKDAKDGKHTICINNSYNGALFEEEWKYDFFPFVFFRWGLRSLGFWGQGLSEQLTGIQLEINKILRTIQISMHLVSIPKIFVEANSQIVSAHLNNKIGGIVKFLGTPPIPGSLGSIPAELFTHLDRLFSRAYEIAGVSSLSATSLKPAGLDSGKALREYNDLETERFMSVAQRYEQAFLDASKIMIQFARDIYENDQGYSVKVAKGSFISTIKWKDVNIEEDKYSMQVFPTSFLSSTPAGKLQDVQELIEIGFIGKEDGMKLLDFPDLKEFYNFNNAGVEDIERQIENMIDNNTYETPEPYQNLELGITKMQQAYLRFRSEGAPDSKLELFRRWIEDANGLIKKAVNQQMVDQAQATEEARIQAEQANGIVAPEAIEEEPVLDSSVPMDIPAEEAVAPPIQ